MVGVGSGTTREEYRRRVSGGPVLMEEEGRRGERGKSAALKRSEILFLVRDPDWIFPGLAPAHHLPPQ